MKPFTAVFKNITRARFRLLQKIRGPILLLGWVAGMYTGVGAQVFEDPVFRQRAAAGLEQVYNLAFEEAHSDFMRLQTDYPDHPAPDFLLALNRWWQTYLSENTPAYHDYIDTQIGEALRKNASYASLPAYELEYAFFQYMCYAFRARLYVLRKQYWPAVGAGRKALAYLKKGFAFTGRAPEFFFSSGIYHYYAATYPQDHPIVRPFMLFFPNGDAALGLRQLESAATQANFAQTEARFYLTEIYLRKEKSYDLALRNARGLAGHYPGNTWFQADYAEALFATRAYAAAESVLNRLEQRFAAIPGHDTRNISSLESTLTSQLMMRVYHDLGRVYLAQRKETRRSIACFEKSLKVAGFAGVQAHPLIPASHYYLGVCYDRAGMRAAALTAYREAISLPENDAVKAPAKACLESPCTQ